MSEHQVEVNRYRFSAERLSKIGSNAYATNQWPLVYLLSDEGKRRAYVGEAAHAVGSV
jgi:uncharacterized protein